MIKRDHIIAFSSMEIFDRLYLQYYAQINNGLYNEIDFKFFIKLDFKIKGRIMSELKTMSRQVDYDKTRTN